LQIHIVAASAWMGLIAAEVVIELLAHDKTTRRFVAVSAGVKARLFAAVLGCRAHTVCVVKNLSYDFCSGTSNGHKNRVWA
jgi:hypothetical protein